MSPVSSCMHCPRPIVLAACLTAHVLRCLAVNAAESPSVQVTIDGLTTIDTITSAELGGARAHINFPYLKQHANGDLIANYSVGQTQSGTQFGRQSVSVDGGQSWILRMSQVSGDGVQASLIRPAGQFSRGFGVYAQNAAGFTTFSNSRYNSSDGGVTWDNGFEDALYTTGGITYNFFYGNFGDVVEAGGSLYMSLYGTRPGSTRNESVLFVSNDDGKNWTRRSTIASYTNSLDLGQMGTEGPSETAMLGLDNGDLLAVYRTGQPFPNSTINALTPSLFWSISHDQGFTWTAAKSLGVAGVLPLMRKLDDGAVALTFGRYGGKVMFADASGTRWTTPTAIYNGPGSGHTEMRQRADGRYVFVYDQSGFYPPSWNAGPPAGYVYDSDQSANLKAATLNIQHAPANEPFAWSLEYHGDATPTALNQGWSAIQNGSISTRFLAELGQDYIRINTGTAGSDNSLSYAIDGAPGTAWAGIDFGQGAVLEIRARAGSTSTAESSASIFLGDGIHGAVTLELDGDSVNLEGLGDSVGQVEYSAANQPGFSSRTWHDYRLTIQPLSAGGGAIAQLFLDGNFDQAILSQQLSSSLVDEIRFGDLTGMNNGILELDYLRFAPQPSVTLLGDYNSDGKVDAADYAAWRDNFGTGNVLPNDASPGSVTLEDYDVWKSRFGAMAGSGAAAANAVPEPKDVSYLVFAVLGLALWSHIRFPRINTLWRAALGRKPHIFCLLFSALVALTPPATVAAPGRRFDDLTEAEQQRIRDMCAAPDAVDRDGPYSTPMYYLMHKGYVYEGDSDLNPNARCYDKMKGKRGIDWGSWKLDRNHPDWQEAMVQDWAELGLNSTHFNVYPVDGQLQVDPDWAVAVTDFIALSQKHGLKVGVRLDAIDETKLWTVHPNNPQSQRDAYLKWVAQIAELLQGHTIYYVLGDELTLRQPAHDLAKDAWTPAMYLEYFSQMSDVIRRADPNAKVCMFAASSGEWFNVKWMLEHGYAELGDGVAINHYDYKTAPKFLADRDRLAPGKMFLTSGVGYASNGVVKDRYPEGDGYAPAPDEQTHAAQIAKTMFMWWDLGADAAPYYITLRNWVVDGKVYPRWFGFFGFEDYIIENGQLSVKRYPAWYAFQTVARTFYNRSQMRTPQFAVTSNAEISTFRSFEHVVPGGRELLIVVWNEDRETPAKITLATDGFRHPVRVSLKDFRRWESLDSEVLDGMTTLELTVNAEPQIIRLVDCGEP